MTVLADATSEVVDDRLAARNALVLAAAQALAGANITVVVATGGITGAILAPDKALATLPVSLLTVGMWIGTLPVGMLAKRRGRRFALQIGSAFGVLGGLVSWWAILSGSFLLFLFGTLCGGFYAAAQLSYRFTATDTASPQFRAKAVAWVLAGGVFAALIGPQLIIFTKDIWPVYLFVGTFLALAACAVVNGAVLSLLKLPPPRTARHLAPGRPLGEIVRNPQFIVAAACGVASYVIMNFMMTAAPLAMVTCHHSVGEAALAVQWHVMGMYAPSFFTGALIGRFGVRTIAASGLALIAVAAATAVLGIALWNFWVALALLGVGWNFAFIGATTLVTQCHDAHERNKVQAFNDFLIFGSMAVGSFASGALLARFDWTAVNAVVFPVVAVAGLLLARATPARRPTLA